MKFNTKTDINVGTTINLAGGLAYTVTPELEFVSLVLTTFVEKSFYETNSKTIVKLIDLMNKIPDKKFIAKTAVYARTVFGMRSVTHIIAAELAKNVKEQPWMKDFIYNVIHRPDDMTEILAYYINKYGKPVPNSLKKGFAKAFTKFDEYQIAKYRNVGEVISLVDVVNIVHPKLEGESGEAVKQLVNGTLRSKDTWESELTKIGQMQIEDEEKDELKAKAWKRLIDDRKLGYFALVRNLRNILHNAPDAVPQAIEMLTDERLISKSLVLPFRFSTAIKEIKEENGDLVSDLIIGLNKAVDISLKNTPVFEGKTLVVVDVSGSMEGKPIEIASLFASILVKSNKADLMVFDDDARYMSINPMDSTLTIAEQIMSKTKSGGTNFHSIFEEANRDYDRIIILSDMQGWLGYNSPIISLDEYKERCGADPMIYSFDLAGYGSLQFPQRRVFALAGFSDKVLELMPLLEKDRNALINEVQKIDLQG